jgi:hypothetical protein
LLLPDDRLPAATDHGVHRHMSSCATRSSFLPPCGHEGDRVDLPRALRRCLKQAVATDESQLRRDRGCRTSGQTCRSAGSATPVTLPVGDRLGRLPCWLASPTKLCGNVVVARLGATVTSTSRLEVTLGRWRPCRLGERC